jgi:integrative and conjugative element protein (TIGR02256 family)
MTIWLDALARDKITREACSRRLVETGGPLFGYAEKADVVITHACGPGRDAQHRPTRFSCARGWVTECIAEVFEETSGKASYLGEWHTHPLSRARPSGADQRAVEQIAYQCDVELPQPTILIQSTKIFRRRVHVSTLAAYRWDSHANTLVEHELMLGSLAAGLSDATSGSDPDD